MFRFKSTKENAAKNSKVLEKNKNYKKRASKKREQRKNKKVVFGIRSLDLRGSSRILVDILKQIAKVFDVTLITIYSDGVLEKELETYNIKIKSIFKVPKDKVSKFRYKINKFLLRLFSTPIYKALLKDNYNVEIAFDDSEILDIFSCKSKAYKIAWIHNYLGKKDLNLLKKLSVDSELDAELSDERLAHGFKKYSKFKTFDKLVFVSKSCLTRFKQAHLDNDQEKQVIYNYLDTKRIKSALKNGFAYEIIDDIPSFCVVSNITRRKGLFRLLNVHKRLIDEGYIHNIYIIGYGINYDTLNEKRLELGLKKSFVLLGKKDNPYPYIQKANFFALPSYHEGYSVVLDEARLLNKEIITTKLAGKEAATGYHKATIAENTVDGVYKAMKKLLNKNKYKKFKNKKRNKKNNNSKNINNEFMLLNSNKIYKIIELIDETGGK